jgi:hypothetical protein
MVLEVLFLFLLTAGIAIIAYRGAVHEFQILQKTYDDEGANLSELLTEMLPIVVRNVPKRWLGGWTANRIGMKPYEIQVRDQDQNKYKIPWNLWLQDSKGTRPVTLEPVAASLHLHTASSAMSDDGFTRWCMIPHSTPVPQLLHPQDVMPLTKAVPEFTVITVTDGAPIEVWLAHEGAIPSDELFGENPWEVTSHQISWISDVKYIEIRLRPNNTLAIPRHWSYAVRNVEDTASWFHITAFHTPISKVVSVLKGLSSPQK